MRNWVAAVFGILGVLFGYALAPLALNAQPLSVPFVSGQRLMLTFSPDRTPGMPSQVTCVVTLREGEFIGCRRDRAIGSDEREVWYNLRFVEQVEKRER
jgi:hypothetical protein